MDSQKIDFQTKSFLDYFMMSTLFTRRNRKLPTRFPSKPIKGSLNITFPSFSFFCNWAWPETSILRSQASLCHSCYYSR